MCTNPCYSRDDDNDIDSELYCSDLVVDTYADGYYYAIKGRLEDMMERMDEIAENPEDYSLGEFTLDTGRIGVYDYHKAIEEQPELKERIESKEIIATVIKDFTGTITSVTDEDYSFGIPLPILWRLRVDTLCPRWGHGGSSESYAFA